MDFFALPDVFLRKLMRKVSIKDRLNMRLTSRAFERLVGDTHAGYFESGSVVNDSSEINLTLVEGVFKNVEMTEDGVTEHLERRCRIFNGISFGYFTFKLYDHIIPHELRLRLLEKIKVHEFVFHVPSEEQLDSSLRLMEDFPSSRYSIHFQYIPEPAKLLSLAQMETLNIQNRGQIPVDVFLQLLSTHKSIHSHFQSITLAEADLQTTMELIANHPGERSIQLNLRTEMIKSWLAGYGITQASSVAGDTSRRLTVVWNGTDSDDRAGVILRYGKCTITVFGLWIYSIIKLVMTNCE